MIWQTIVIGVFVGLAVFFVAKRGGG